MRVVADLEADGLQPTKIHILIAKDIDTGEVYEFFDSDKDRALEFSRDVSLWVGHYFLGYDLGVLNRLWDLSIPFQCVRDTLVLSRLTDATRSSHSLESWGEELGQPKLHTDIKDWSVLTPEMAERCRGDVETNYLLFKKFEKYLSSPRWRDAVETEHFIAYHCGTLRSNGFAFDYDGAVALKAKIDGELNDIDRELVAAFPPRLVPVREVVPRGTKHGTIAKNSIPKALGPDLSGFYINAPFTFCRWEEFNPGSPKQIVTRLNEAGWRPTEPTKGHSGARKALQQLKRKRRKGSTDYEEITALEAKLVDYAVTGWQVCEENLKTLPETAPAATQRLVRRLLLSSRSGMLEQWLNAYNLETGRIHGSFNHIEPWTHRMSHARPNMGNIPKFDARQPDKTPYSDQMRALWRAGHDRYLVGVDAESIQLRIFGHYINDPGFIKALTSGSKEDGTDPHSLNQKALGPVCRSRDAAKTFIYAWLLGAGIAKVAAILGCSKEEAQISNDNFLEFYPGLRYLKEAVIPIDALRGYFEGFDGRYVKIWGEDVDQRQHFALAGYLQNGEAIIMKRAVQIWYPKLVKEGVPFWWVNFVHDEYQTETPRDMEVAKYVAQSQADAIRQVGDDLGLLCPMAGSVLSAHGKLAIGDNWLQTH